MGTDDVPSQFANSLQTSFHSLSSLGVTPISFPYLWKIRLCIIFTHQLLFFSFNSCLLTNTSLLTSTLYHTLPIAHETIPLHAHHLCIPSHPLYRTLSYLTLSMHPFSPLVPYLARRLHALPQGEVHEDEHREEAEGERSFDGAEVAEPLTPVHLQHLHPAADTSRDSEVQRIGEKEINCLFSRKLKRGE